VQTLPPKFEIFIGELNEGAVATVEEGGGSDMPLLMIILLQKECSFLRKRSKINLKFVGKS
jgi:hypothetical protein